MVGKSLEMLPVMRWQHPIIVSLMASALVISSPVLAASFSPTSSNTPNDTTLVDVDMLSPTVGWAIDAEGQVLKTAKGSRHWSNVSPRRLTVTLKPLAAKDFHGGKTVAFPNPWTAWITVPDPTQNAAEIWHTADGGGHWHESTIHGMIAGGLGFTYLAAIGNHDAWILGTTQGLAGSTGVALWQTTGTKAHWTRVWSQIVGGEIMGLQFLNGRDGIVTGTSLTAHALLVESSNGGRSWHSSPLSLPSDAYSPSTLAPSIVSASSAVLPVWLGLGPNTDKEHLVIFRTLTAGRTWTKISSLPGTFTIGSTITTRWVNANQGWLLVQAADSAHLYDTNNGGQTWTTLSVPAGVPLSLDRVSSQMGFMLMQVRTDTILYQTRDGGNQWISSVNPIQK